MPTWIIENLLILITLLVKGISAKPYYNWTYTRNSNASWRIWNGLQIGREDTWRTWEQISVHHGAKNFCTTSIQIISMDFPDLRPSTCYKNLRLDGMIGLWEGCWYYHKEHTWSLMQWLAHDLLIYQEEEKTGTGEGEKGDRGENCIVEHAASLFTRLSQRSGRASCAFY